MTGSIFDAVQDAIDHARRELFPFRAGRWLALGFLAFLDQCGRTGGGSNFPTNFNLPLPSDEDEGTQELMAQSPGVDQALEWIASHVGLVVAIALGSLMLVVSLTALLLWLNSRGIFMYLDAVTTGRVEIGRAWREHAERARSLFAWRFVLAMVGFAGVLIVLAVAAVVALQWHRGSLDGGMALAIGLLGLLPILLVFGLGLTLLQVLLRDFVAPLQWLHGWTCSEAVRVAMGLVRSEMGAMALYVVLKIVFVVALTFASMLAGCLTCCLGFLPVLSQTLVQPLLFFERAFSLCVLRRLGHDVFAATPRPLLP